MSGIYTKPRYKTDGDMIMPQDVIKTLYEVTGGDAIITSDVGQHQMFAAQYYHFNRPRQWINSGGLGTMGFGLPSAMGAAFAVRDKDVVCVTGEGSIQMCIQELSTLTQYGIPVKIICLNNQALGMVKQWQDMVYGSRYSEIHYEDSLPDFVKLMDAYGHVGSDSQGRAAGEDGRVLCHERPHGIYGHLRRSRRARLPDAGGAGWLHARHVAEQNGEDLR